MRVLGFENMAACVREAAGIAAQTKSVLAFEPEVNNVVDLARKARRLMDEIGSAYLKVTMDPANVFLGGTLPRMKEIITRPFSTATPDSASLRETVTAPVTTMSRSSWACRWACGWVGAAAPKR